MNLLTPPKILIKITTPDHPSNPQVGSFPVGDDGIKIIHNKNELSLSINQKHFLKVNEFEDSIRIDLDNSQYYYIFHRDSKFNSSCAKIKFNKALTKECFAVIQKYFQKAVDEYFDEKIRITLILDTSVIAQETLSNLKNKKIDYIKKEPKKSQQTISFRDVRDLIEKERGIPSRHNDIFDEVMKIKKRVQKFRK